MPEQSVQVIECIRECFQHLPPSASAEPGISPIWLVLVTICGLGGLVAFWDALSRWREEGGRGKQK